MASPLENAIDFLVRFGFFDVVLPFLLVFTIVFAILEKTRIFGVENGKPKKNLNSMVAFSIALFVVLAKEIVYTIQIALPLVFLVLLIVICFMLLAGSFMGDKEFSFENKKWAVFLTVVMFLSVILIFLYAFGYLGAIIGYIVTKWSDTLISSLILLAAVVGTIFYVVGGKSDSKPKEETG